MTVLKNDCFWPSGHLDEIVMQNSWLCISVSVAVHLFCLVDICGSPPRPHMDPHYGGGPAGTPPPMHAPNVRDQKDERIMEEAHVLRISQSK